MRRRPSTFVDETPPTQLALDDDRVVPPMMPALHAPLPLLRHG